MEKTTFKGAPKLQNDCITRFVMIRAENVGNVMVRTIKINFISCEFDELELMVSGFFDSIIVTETKLIDNLSHTG